MKKRMVTVCAWCGRIQKEDKTCASFNLRTLEKVFIEQPNTIISHGMCHNCLAKFKKEMG